MDQQKRSNDFRSQRGPDNGHGSLSGNGLKELGPAFPFLELPPEIRLRIYRWAVGNRAIHISHQYKGWPHTTPSKLCHSFCRCTMSEFEIYEKYAQPVTFKNRVDWHMRPREETVSKPHDCCSPSSKATLEVGVGKHP